MLKDLVDFFGVWTVVLSGASIFVGVVISAALSSKASAELEEFSRIMPSDEYIKKLKDAMDGGSDV